MSTEAEEKSISYSNCLPVIYSGTNGAVENEAIQKFLSVCLDQFFNRSGDKQTSFVTEIFKEQESSQEDTSISSFDSSEFTCKFCNYKMTPVTLAMKDHLDACPLFPVKCPNMCGEMAVPRVKLSNHLMEECPNTCEQCVYQDIGCSFQGSKSRLAMHLKENSEEHLRMAVEVVREQRAELDLQRNRLKKHEENISQLMENVSKLTALYEESLQEKTDREKAITRLSEQVREQKKHQAKYEKELRHRFTELEKSGSEMPPNGLFRYPGLNGYSEQVWRISSFSRKLQRVQSGRSDDPITSEPFYTSAFGYKVVAWAYLNGRGKEEGKGLSIYACVASGEYDAILKWPIKPRYTFALLDQSPDAEVRKDLVRTRKVHDFKRDDARRKGIDRPGRDERAIIVGFDDFVKHEELEPGNFLCDDCLFIRILVDIPDP